MKHKFVVLLVLVAMCLSLVPATIIANHSNTINEQDAQEEFHLEAFMPKLEFQGQMPYKLETAKNANYTAEVKSYEYFAPLDSDEQNHVVFNKNEVFTYGKYKAIIWFHAKEGFTFPEQIVAPTKIHNGDDIIESNGAVSVSINQKRAAIAFTFEISKTIIDEVNVNLHAAILGQKPNTVLQLDEDANYTGNLDWGRMANTTYEKDHQYVGEITLTAKQGCEFPVDANHLKVNVTDENGPVSLGAISLSKEECIIPVIYDFRDPSFQEMNLQFTLPDETSLISDPFEVTPINEKEKLQYSLQSTTIRCVSHSTLDSYEEGHTYLCCLEVCPKEGYRIMDFSYYDNISITDQYGQSYDCYVAPIYNEQKDYTSMHLEFRFRIPNTYTARFGIFNGTWKDGTNDYKTVKVPVIQGNAILKDDQIPKPEDMIANEGYENGHWDNEQALHEPLTQDTRFIYRFDKQKHAKVTMKIVNGSWVLHDGKKTTEDIIIDVPLTNGSGTLQEEDVPFDCIPDQGCVKGSWDQQPDLKEQAIKEDVTYTYTCKQVLQDAIHYELAFKGLDEDNAKKAFFKTQSADQVALKYSFIISNYRPHSNGYDFIEWNTKEDGSGQPYKAGETITLGYQEPCMTLYAQYKKLTSRTIEYIGNGANESDMPKDESIYPNANGNYYYSIPTIPYPKREGYKFLGYELVSYKDDTIQATSKYHQPLEMLVLNSGTHYQLIAHWKEHEKQKFILKYDGTGGFFNCSETGTEVNDDFAVFEVNPNLATREGYIFKGWNTKEDGSGSAYQGSDEIVLKDEVTTLYAQWEKDPTYHPSKKEQLKQKVTHAVSSIDYEDMIIIGVSLVALILIVVAFKRLRHS